MLLDVFTDIFNNKEDSWKYYSCLVLDSPFLNECSAHRFIKDYLQYSGKFDLYLKTDLEYSRKSHTVSVFFLGIHLLEKLQAFYYYDIQNFVDSYKTRVGIKSAFSFYWFLTCLYHDIGYFHEQKKDPRYSNFQKLESTLHHKPRIIKDPFIPKILLQSIEKYYNNHHCFDHGIIGGYKQYDSIINLYQYINVDGKVPGSANLVLDKSFIPVFRSIARTISVHNIWFCFEEIESKEKCTQYENNGIKSLIIKKGATNPINFVDHPLLYTLCLADTIDPVKIIHQYAEKNGIEVNFLEILNQVNLDFETKDKLVLTTQNPLFGRALLERFPDDNSPKINKYWLGIDIRFRSVEL